MNQNHLAIGRRVVIVGILAALATACAGRRDVASGSGETRAAAAAVSRIRAQHGLSALQADNRMERAALDQSRRMASAGRMVHEVGYSGGFARRMGANGIGGPAAENIAHARWGIDEVLDVWMNSPGHRRNMLDQRFTRFGLGWVPDPDGSGRRYWTMVLGA